MLLSIIIPAYNVKAYLRTCVESVSAFPVDAKEIIIIDDGCTDGTFDEADAWLKTLSCKCEVIHQANGGVSKARNRGIDVAKGEWLWFVDADDVVDCEAKMDYGQLKESNFVVTGFTWEENGQVVKHEAKSLEVPYNLWRCWFRKDIIDAEKLRFVEGRRYAEDQEFIWNYLTCDDKKYKMRKNAYALKEPIYYYVVRQGSAMTRKDVKRKKLADTSKVICSFVLRALNKGMLFQSWVLQDLKRMLKVLYVMTMR